MGQIRTRSKPPIKLTFPATILKATRTRAIIALFNLTGGTCSNERAFYSTLGFARIFADACRDGFPIDVVASQLSVWFRETCCGGPGLALCPKTHGPDHAATLSSVVAKSECSGTG